MITSVINFLIILQMIMGLILIRVKDVIIRRLTVGDYCWGSTLAKQQSQNPEGRNGPQEKNENTGNIFAF